MISTVRFTETGGYLCKPLNIVTTKNEIGVTIETINNTPVLAVDTDTNIQLDTGREDANFTFTIANVSIRSVLPISGSTYSKKVSGFVGFGYPHKFSGLPFVINVSNTPQDLVITKNNGTVSITFGNSSIDLQSDIVGPVIDLNLGFADIESDGSRYFDLCLGNITYSTN